MLNPNKQGKSYHHQVKHLIIENSDLTSKKQGHNGLIYSDSSCN